VSDDATKTQRVDALRAAFRKVVTDQDCPACSPDDCDVDTNEAHIRSMILTHDDGIEALAEVDRHLPPPEDEQ
jgi:hypothetical protein